MAANLVTLMTAFNDGSMQQEKTSTNFVDSFVTEAYGLKKHNFDIVVMSNPPIPQSVGFFLMSHEVEGEPARLVNHKPCMEIPYRMAKLDAYWTSRLGLRYIE